MRAASNGFSATLLLLVPLLAVPFLAAVGLPQFSSTPAAANVEQPDMRPVAHGESGVDLRDRGMGEPVGPSADDLFAPFESADERLETAYDAPVSADARDPDRRSRVRSRIDAVRDDWRTGETRGGRPAADSPPGADRISTGPEPQFEREPLVYANAFESEPRAGATAAAVLEPRLPDDFADPPEQPATAGDAPPFGESPSGFALDASEREATALTWDSAVRRMKQIGVDDFSLSPGSGDSRFHFRCHLTAAQDLTVTHRFEAEAAEPLAAVDDVLGQVEDWLEQTAGRGEAIEGRLARLGDPSSGRD